MSGIVRILGAAVALELLGALLLVMKLGGLQGGVPKPAEFKAYVFYVTVLNAAVMVIALTFFVLSVFIVGMP